MRSDPEGIVEAIYASWRARDLAALMAYCGDDIVFTIHVPQDSGAFAGESCGRTAMLARLKMIVAEFDFLRFEPGTPIIDGERVKVLVDFHGRHISSGQDIVCRLRHVWHFAGGRLVRIDEFHDGEMVRAFMNLARATAASRQA
jgi:ketosteroid isomerase-like protein